MTRQRWPFERDENSRVETCWGGFIGDVDEFEEFDILSPMSNRSPDSFDINRYLNDYQIQGTFLVPHLDCFHC